MRSDLPWRGLTTCHLRVPFNTHHSPHYMQGLPSPNRPPTPPSSPGVHIWGDPTIYPVTGYTPGTILAPSSPACQSSAPSSCPDSLCPVPSSLTHLANHPAQSPCSSLSSHSPRADTAPPLLRTLPWLPSALRESELLGLAQRPCMAWSLRIPPTHRPLRPSECSPC